jgi:uncharacterized protein YdiU (UPF0061 family)
LASAHESLAAFGPQFEAVYFAGLRRKIGIFSEEKDDTALAQELLKCMATNRADFTLTFRRLCDAVVSSEGNTEVRSLFAEPESYDLWAAKWRRRLEKESVSSQERVAAMRMTNPLFMPRNHLVEAAIDAAVEQQNFQPFEELLDVVSSPYEDRPDSERYARPASPEECVSQTFCGT